MVREPWISGSCGSAQEVHPTGRVSKAYSNRWGIGKDPLLNDMLLRTAGLPVRVASVVKNCSANTGSTDTTQLTELSNHER